MRYKIITKNPLTEAYCIACKYHKGQKRDNSKPYVMHLYNVQKLLLKIGATLEIQIAGVLHDILEDTDCPEKLIEDKFGLFVLDLVKEVTKDKILGKAFINSKEGWLVKFCDIIDNCTDFAGWDEPRLRNYIKEKRIFLELS